jgi:hypothetical protein
MDLFLLLHKQLMILLKHQHKDMTFWQNTVRKQLTYYYKLQTRVILLLLKKVNLYQVVLIRV